MTRYTIETRQITDGTWLASGSASHQATSKSDAIAKAHYEFVRCCAPKRAFDTRTGAVLAVFGMEDELAPSNATIARNVGEVMSRAVRSAVELGNFPLSSVDVQCAFENWADERKQNHDDRFTGVIVSGVLGALVKLGFSF
jgi:hypothetical protein